MLTRSAKRQKINDRSNYTSVSGFRNMINGEPLLDYLELINYKGKEISSDTLQIKPKTKEKYKKTIKKERKSSFDYIMKNGKIFEKNTIEEIKRRMKKNNDLKRIIDLSNHNKDNKYELTKNLLLSRKPMVILGGLMYDDKREIFGYPDLIVNGEFIKKYFCHDAETVYDNNNNKKRKFHDINDNNKDTIKENIEGNLIIENNIDDQTYYIIDIKSSSLDLIGKGKTLGGSKMYDFYKFQVYSYSLCLKTFFEENGLINNANVGFLMGRKYSARINKEDKYFGSFENLATIEYTDDFISSCDKNCKDGKKWLVNDLRLNYSQFTLNPINKKELYPNMKNTYDGIYHGIKKKIAIQNKEITLLYYCGPDKRNKCHELGITSFDDERLTAEILGFKGKSNEKIIERMLSFEKNNKKILIEKKINNHMDWQEINDHEFFVDFETYGKENINRSDEDTIYMIGVCYEGDFKCFIINKNYDIKKNIKDRNEKLNCTEDNYVLCNDEYDLMRKFTDYIYSMKKNKNESDAMYLKNIRLVHWSPFEQRVFTSKINKYSLNKNKFTLNWYDLLNVFKHQGSPILIKDCWSFKLKDVTNKMNEHGFINIGWPDLEDGLLSSFMARDIYEKNDKKNKNNLIVDITEYNYIDCKCMHDILTFIRNYKE